MTGARLDGSRGSGVTWPWTCVEWIARSRGADDEAIKRGWARLESKDLAVDRAITDEGRAFRRRLEDRTDELSGQMWELAGEEVTVALCELIEPHHEAVIARVDATAGPNWMPASRVARP